MPVRKMMFGFLCLALTLCWGCSSGKTGSQTYSDAQSLLAAIWDAQSGEKPDVIGGLGDTRSDNMPLGIDKDLCEANLVEESLAVPANLVDVSSSAACMMDADNPALFTASAWQVISLDASELASEISMTCQSFAWSSGVPQEYFILSWEDYLVYAYGKEDVLDNFLDACRKVLSDCDVLYHEPLT